MFKHLLRRGWVALPGALALLTLGLQLRDWPSQKFWNDWAWLSVVAVFVAAAVAVLDPVYAAWRDWRSARQAERANLVEQVLKTALIDIDKATRNTELPWHKIGLHVWEVTQRWRRKICPWKPPPFERVARLRIGPTTRSSRVRWVEGKGVIGQACANNQLVRVDLGYRFAEYAPSSATPDEWEALDAEFRLGMSWSELQRTKPYGGVLAVPITDLKGNVRGCLSLDGPPGSFGTLDQEKIYNIIIDAANTVGETLYG